jgi:cerevisin
MQDVILGVNYAATEALAKARRGERGFKGSVANMSLGGGKSQALDDAVNAAVEEYGLHFAVAAGNDNRCVSPSSIHRSLLTDKWSGFVGTRALSRPLPPRTPSLSALRPSKTPRPISRTMENVSTSSPLVSTSSLSGTTATSRSTPSRELRAFSFSFLGMRASRTYSIVVRMASPHIAGLAAYYLSLYPHAFTPTAEDYAAAGVPMPKAEADVFDIVEQMIDTPSFLDNGKQLIFERIRVWTGFGKSKVLAPTPKNPTHIDPKVLKKAMIRLATEGILTVSVAAPWESCHVEVASDCGDLARNCLPRR